jgi:hypothetical protein
VTTHGRIEAGRRERRGLARGLPCRVAAGADRTGMEMDAGPDQCREDFDPHLGHRRRAVTLWVHELVAGAGLDALDAALGELTAAAWPVAEHPDCGEDTELDGRDLIADCLDDEVGRPSAGLPNSTSARGVCGVTSATAGLYGDGMPLAIELAAARVEALGVRPACAHADSMR